MMLHSKTIALVAVSLLILGLITFHSKPPSSAMTTALAERLRQSRQANDRSREGCRHWDIVAFEWQYNMDNIHAALLLPQMDRLDATWQKREAVVRWHRGLLTEDLKALFPDSR
jgi:dTDP-4-amino-4,6-dideoxygalactose transaminase